MDEKDIKDQNAEKAAEKLENSTVSKSLSSVSSAIESPKDLTKKNVLSGVERQNKKTEQILNILEQEDDKDDENEDI